MKDDATYTATISGPGFSVTAERGVDEDDVCPYQNLTDAVGDAIGMMGAEHMPRMDSMLARIVERHCDWTGKCVDTEFDERERTFYYAALDIRAGWEKRDKEWADHCAEKAAKGDAKHEEVEQGADAAG